MKRKKKRSRRKNRIERSGHHERAVLAQVALVPLPLVQVAEVQEAEGLLREAREEGVEWMTKMEE